jgi:hypothetical protein
MNLNDTILGTYGCLHFFGESEATILEYNGIKISGRYPHVVTKLNAIVDSPKFRKWLDDINREEIELKEFCVTDVDFFGPVHPSKLGFVKGYGVAFNKITGS